jgi:hypothetical protein
MQVSFKIAVDPGLGIAGKEIDNDTKANTGLDHGW